MSPNAKSGASGGFQPPSTRRASPSPYALKPRRKLAGRFTLMVLFALAAVFGSLTGLMLVYSVNLPQINDLERYRPSSMTDLYDRKGHLIGSIALEHRVDVGYNDFAPVLRQAVISIEDKNFESHWGINVFRIAGALVHDLRSHGRSQGASTLTMQLARNLFLPSERTYGRKIQEAFLAIQIERSFTKEQIFTLYGNQIYLGHGNYGFEAASEYYFSCHARDLTLTEAALLAGLPKGPVAYSPLLNPEKALRRRNLVLTEMESDHVISHAEAEAARNSPLGLHISQPEVPVAPWFVEEVRRELNQHFGADVVLESGLRVDTTLDLDLQRAANHAVLDGLAAYERRRGWRGAAVNVLTQGVDPESYKHPDWATHAVSGDYTHALVTRVLPLEIRARVGERRIVMTPADWQWTGQAHGDVLVKPGDVIYVHLSGAMEGNAERATLEQDSGAQGALMAMDNTTGDVLAMVGGRDYALSQFNRATQAERQTGSSFKPYVYTAAIESGMTPEDTVMDSPVSFGSYRPHDYENNYKGRMSLLEAFADSRNIPALRLANRVGIRTVIETAHRFGVTSEIPPYLPIALGAVEITLAEQMQSYAVFPNDGIRVQAHLVRSVTSADGVPLWQPSPTISQVISQQTARSMMELLRAVTREGTAAAAAALNHPLGGKTGTTSNFTDAWFMGFSPSVTCGVWVGFDSRQSLGDKETGARAALPIWAGFMRAAIAEHPVESFPGDGSAAEKVAGSRKSSPGGEGKRRAGPIAVPVRMPVGVPVGDRRRSGLPLPEPAALPGKHSAAPAARPGQSVPAGSPGPAI